jgi:hypothetical protein
MEEYIGECFTCRRPVYCLNGFLDGVVSEGKVYCFECAESRLEN